MSVQIYKILQKNIIVSNGKVYLCNNENKQIFSLSRFGFGLERLFSEFIALFVKIFFRGEEKKKLTVRPHLIDLSEDSFGKLKFQYEYNLILE